MRRTWHKLEKQRGKLGMTWRFKVQGAVIALVILGVVVLAASADYINWSDWIFGF